MDPILLERLGNLHLVILHLPIGLVAAAVLMEIWCWRNPSAERNELSRLILGANAVAALLAAGAGLLLAEHGSYVAKTLLIHRWAGVACAGVAVVTWLLRVGGKLWLARASLGLLLLVTTVAGHYGATLTHGPEVTAWWSEQSPPTVPAVVLPGEADSVFVSTIQPLLANKCIDCHGPRKARGGLRLDSREAALAGGKGGLAAIVPGDPDASELMLRVRLPETDDDVMPAEEGEHLTDAQIQALAQWIAAGAVWR